MAKNEQKIDEMNELVDKLEDAFDESNVDVDEALIEEESENSFDESDDEEDNRISFDLQREKFYMKKEGRKVGYWKYFVEGTSFDGKTRKVIIQGSEKGAFDVLDMIFEFEGTAQFYRKQNIMVDSATNRRQTIDVYFVENIAPDGSPFEFQVKLDKTNKALYEVIERFKRFEISKMEGGK